MSTLLRCLLALTVAGAVAACGAKQGRFVKPVATPVAQDPVENLSSKFADGYLRIFVSSNLDAKGHTIDFGEGADRPAMLLISARFGKGTVASFAADADPEIPVLLYDVQAGKTVSSVVDNALLSEGLLVDPESLSKSPHLQIVVRGVPADKAKWVTNLLEIATGEPMLKFGMGFVPGGQVVSGLSSKLGELLSDEIKTEKKNWEEKTLLGLRSDQGLDALHGRQFVVMLNPNTIEFEAAAPNLRRCERAHSPSGLCEADGKPWLPAQAYVRFELDVTDFRSIKDFIGSAVSCEADERVWADYRALLASGQLARRQTEYERYLLARGELLLQARRAQDDTPSWRRAGRLLQFAQQSALLPSADDAFWVKHFSERASQIEACVRAAAVRGQSQYAAIWDHSTALFERAQSYPEWTAELAANAAPEAPVLRKAERELAQLRQVMTVPELRALDADSLESLRSLDGQLQQMLLPAYERIAERILESDDTFDGQAERLSDLFARSACMSCRQMLSAEVARLREPPAPEPPPGTPTTAAISAAATEAPPAAEPQEQTTPSSSPAADPSLSPSEPGVAVEATAAAIPTAPAAAPQVPAEPAPAEPAASAATSPE
ncbi:hypothetical protein [Panacagrimonas sp.]|uniref:hypothetical protein n=1 Tax=Panacagrimonas sp. TaxID=2480088 RepID=UPI003B52FD66